MTLIVCLHPKRGRALLADCLITAAGSGNDLTIPMRVYIPPERHRGMHRKPADFRRKVIEIRPDLVALWAGKVGLAETFARRVRDWFKNQPPTADEMHQFFDVCCHDLVDGLYVIMVSALTPVYFMLGPVVQSSAPFAGEYAVAGQGKEIFVSMINEMQPRNDEVLSPAMDALRIASDLLAREIITKDTIFNGFGGTCEVLYQGPKGFERVDDVMHAVARVDLNTLEIGHYPHVLRQWYEGDQLCVASGSNPETHRQGVESMRFEIPDILGQRSKSSRTIAALAVRPKYFCIHHIFEREGKFLPSTMVMMDDAIEQNFTLFRNGRELTFEPTAFYLTVIREWAELMRNQIQ